MLLPISGLSAEDIALRQDYIQAHVGRDWVPVMRLLPGTPKSIESDAEKQVASALINEFGYSIEGQSILSDVDAVLVWCSSDPGVTELRKYTKIPVIGPGESAFHMAMLQGRRFAYLTPLSVGADRAQKYVRDLGFAERFAGVEVIGTPVLELRKDLEATRQRVGAAGKRALDELGADVLVLGCMGLFQVAESVSRDLGVPVIEPSAAGPRLATMLTAL